ncbi:MAG: hypothetical protein OEX08_03665, partial [Candidatus Nomurabacteria bacterium]|nr:hypothetical protein [Candidatus Nomurabacteria bacterium]
MYGFEWFKNKKDRPLLKKEIEQASVIGKGEVNDYSNLSNEPETAEQIRATKLIESIVDHPSAEAIQKLRIELPFLKNYRDIFEKERDDLESEVRSLEEALERSENKESMHHAFQDINLGEYNFDDSPELESQEQLKTDDLLAEAENQGKSQILEDFSIAQEKLEKITNQFNEFDQKIK